MFVRLTYLAFLPGKVDEAKKIYNRPLVLNDIHTCRKLVVREGTRIDVSVK